MPLRAVVAALILVSGASSALAQSNPHADLAARITGSDAAARDAAVAEVRGKMDDPGPAAILGPLAYTYLPALQKAGCQQEVIDWSLAAVLTASGGADSLQRCHESRARAFAAQKKYEQALGEAKAAYNVAPLKDTGRTLTLFVEILQQAEPGKTEKVEAFKAQQSAGAKATAWPSTGPSPQPSPGVPGEGAGESILKNAKVPDQQAYIERIASPQLKGDDPGQCLRRGNLYLQADKLAEARECFESAGQSATDDKYKAFAVEALARLIKAEDGTIGRANAFVLSLRAGSAATLPAK